MELPRKRIVMQMEELFCIHGASIRCTFVLLSTSMTTFVDVILLREQIMHDRWRCHKNMNWNLLAPLQFVDTHLLCVSICIALQLTNNLFKIHQAIRCCFVFFCFLRIHGTVLTMNCFKFGSLGQPALENPCFCHMANQPRSARFPGR